MVTRHVLMVTRDLNMVTRQVTSSQTLGNISLISLHPAVVIPP